MLNPEAVLPGQPIEPSEGIKHPGHGVVAQGVDPDLKTIAGGTPENVIQQGVRQQGQATFTGGIGVRVGQLGPPRTQSTVHHHLERPDRQPPPRFLESREHRRAGCCPADRRRRADHGNPATQDGDCFHDWTGRIEGDEGPDQDPVGRDPGATGRGGQEHGREGRGKAEDRRGRHNGDVATLRATALEGKTIFLP